MIICYVKNENVFILVWESIMKIVFIRPESSFQIPTSKNSIEALITMLLCNLENDDKFKHEIFIIQRKFGNEEINFQARKDFKKTSIIDIEYRKRRSFFQRVINRFLRQLTQKSWEHFIGNDYFYHVFKTVKQINPDVIIFENYKDPLLKKYVKSFGKNKLFYHVHSDLTGKIIFNLPREVGLIAVSDFVRKTILKNNRNKNLLSYVLPNCANDSFFQQITENERVALRRRLGFSQNDFVVIYCGRIVPEKGVMQLMQAVLRTPKNIKLLIIGGILKNNQSIKTKYISAVNQLATSHDDKIKFTGFLDNQELYRYYQCADLQVVPTLIEEAAGMVLIEGQMSGLPQIITRSGGMVEYAAKDAVILERDNNLVENLTKAILDLATDMVKLEDMGRSAKQNALKFTQKLYYENFLKIVKSIAEKQAAEKGGNDKK